jgi:hypothetical protein
VRILGHRLLTPAGGHADLAFAVIVLFGVHAAHDRQMVHLLGRMRQQFADVRAGHRSRNGAKRAARVGSRLGIPTFKLAQSPGKVEDQNVFLLAGELGQGGLHHARHADHRAAGSAGQSAEELATRQQMLFGLARVVAFHRQVLLR